MRVSFFPNSKHWDVNPTLSFLRRALANYGVTLVKPPGDWLTARWLWTQRGRVDVLHFHWLQYHYRAPGQPGSICALLRFAERVLLARLLGYRIVWTLHNVLPHERARGRLDECARWLMTQLSHAVLVYCEAGRAVFCAHSRHKVRVTGPGTYFGLEPGTVDPAQARAELGLPADAFVYLYFGFIRRYKCVPDLIRAFGSLPGEHLRLLLVGEVQEPAEAATIESLLHGDGRVMGEFCYATEARLWLKLAAADVVVLPFDQILSSSSALMALSAGRPVVAPALGCLPEWIDPACGLLYDPAAGDGLRQAMAAVQSLDIPAMQKAALARAAHFGWDTAARETIAAYHGSPTRNLA
jgi:beta-1,4-mannosyltransferase